ncbi:MAG: prephenate dehydrogenase/arogenate dehydrogenase family protein [Gammaproteobacteria bacterium]|nr:prephenate dehydrogenase/arogenate dehydrogenase family protein [Gammaproteobacteria bacterium]
MINRLCLIGVGLIGGSLALALKRAGACAHVAGVDTAGAALREALELGIIDSGHAGLAEAAAGSDVIVLATPLGRMPSLLQQLAPLLTPKMVLTDVGSAKRGIIEAARKALGANCAAYVPGHPIAGTEKSGPRHALPDLFAGHVVVLTPIRETSAAAIARVRAMWEAAGAIVHSLDAVHHDYLLAATSHLPHMLAYALVDCLARMDEHEEIFRYAAGGFADFTRIAASSPEMWRDVCAANRDNLLAAMDRFEQQLREIRAAVVAADGAALEEIFRRARDARDRFAARRQGAPE